MKAKDKEKWIEALESEKYPKGFSILNNGNEFCCLGVLAEINNIKKERNKQLGFYGYYFDSNTYVTLPPKDFMGLTNSHIDTLAQINDSTSTFKEVIEYIKVNL